MGNNEHNILFQFSHDTLWGSNADIHMPHYVTPYSTKIPFLASPWWLTEQKHGYRVSHTQGGRLSSLQESVQKTTVRVPQYSAPNQKYE